MTETPDSLGTGLALDERLPLRWLPAPAPAELPAVQQANEETLRIILSLDEHHAVEAGEDNAEIAQELVRLESKINLILELVSQVLVRQLDLPAAVPVHLSAHAIEWPADAPPGAADGLVELYVCPRYPRPLRLPARLEPAAGDTRRARFGELGEAVQDLLEKLIFRHHRRRIAATRRGSPA
jgi:hypothetical protein